MTTVDGQDERSWHLDKRLTIGLIVALLTSMGQGVWYESKMDSRLQQVTETEINHENRLAARETWEREDQLTHNKVDSRLAVLETQNATLIAAIQRLEDKLDGYNPGRRK